MSDLPWFGLLDIIAVALLIAGFVVFLLVEVWRAAYWAIWEWSRRPDGKRSLRSLWRHFASEFLTSPYTTKRSPGRWSHGYWPGLKTPDDPDDDD